MLNNEKTVIDFCWQTKWNKRIWNLLQLLWLIILTVYSVFYWLAANTKLEKKFRWTCHLAETVNTNVKDKKTVAEQCLPNPLFMHCNIILLRKKTCQNVLQVWEQNSPTNEDNANVFTARKTNVKKATSVFILTAQRITYKFNSVSCNCQMPLRYITLLDVSDRTMSLQLEANLSSIKTVAVDMMPLFSNAVSHH